MIEPQMTQSVKGRQKESTGGQKGQGKEFCIEPVRFKTRMCKHWERDGYCPYAPKCAFAHGPEDMRSIEINAQAGITRLSRLKALQTRMAGGELWKQQNPSTRNPNAQQHTEVPQQQNPTPWDGSQMAAFVVLPQQEPTTWYPMVQAQTLPLVQMAQAQPPTQYVCMSFIVPASQPPPADMRGSYAQCPIFPSYDS